MSENGATIVLNCLESNSKLQKLLDDKNVQIKRLQGELQTTRLYSVNDNKRQTKNDPPKRTDATKSGRKKAPQQQKSNSLTPSLELVLLSQKNVSSNTHHVCFFKTEATVPSFGRTAKRAIPSSTVRVTRAVPRATWTGTSCSARLRTRRSSSCTGTWWTSSPRCRL